MPDVELGDKLGNMLGTEAQSLFDKGSLTKKEEEDEILKDLMEECSIGNIRDTMHETAQVPESVFFFFNGGDSDEFVKALEFIGLSTINREFSAFLLSDLGRKTNIKNYQYKKPSLKKYKKVVYQEQSESEPEFEEKEQIESESEQIAKEPEVKKISSKKRTANTNIYDYINRNTKRNK